MDRMGSGLPVEVSGKAAKSIGQFFVPSNGTIKSQISGDILHTTVTSGLEKQELFMRIQNIDSIEVTEAPIYVLLGLGSSILLSSLGAFSEDAALGLILLVVGLVIVVWAIKKKRRLMVIHSLRGVVPIYMEESPEKYQQFAKRIMLTARQLNTHNYQQAQQRQTRTDRSDPKKVRSAS